MNDQIKSFVIRNGRCGQKQNQGYLYGLPVYGLSLAHCPWDFTQIFGREAETIIEIGFGMGHSLIKMAQTYPEKNFIGIEVHRPGIGMILSEILRLGLSNLRIAPHDAKIVLKDYIPQDSLAGVQIYFPDPWPKKRHHKRRLVQTEFVNLITSRLAPGGYLHCATDWAPYAEFMLEQIAPCQRLMNTSATGDYVEKPQWRPTTKFEVRGQNLGHEVFDIIYTRQG